MKMKLTKIGRIGRTKLRFLYLLLKLKGFNHSYYSPSRKGIVTLFILIIFLSSTFFPPTNSMNNQDCFSINFSNVSAAVSSYVFTYFI